MKKNAKKLLAVLIAVLMIVNMGTVLMAQAEDSPQATSEPSDITRWKPVAPDDITIGKSYLIVSEYGALVNASAAIPTPGDLNESQTGFAVRPVTFEDDIITSGVTKDMVWQFGEGANTAAASGELGGKAGYYLLNDAPGVGGGTSPLRRESSFNAQHANINTTNPAANGNQQSVLLYNFGDGTVALYIWGGDGQWNFVIAGSEDGFVGKSPAASGTNAEQMLELMQENKLKLYELDNGAGNEHYVMASAGANGSISPSSLTGHVWVNDGEDATFTFTPDFGYVVDKVTVDDEEVEVNGNSYTIQNITQDGIKIHVTFKADENAKEVPFTVYNDVFTVGNVTTALIVDLGEGKAANLADLSADMFSVSTKNTYVLDESNVIYEGGREISRVYVNTAPELLGYSDPAPGSNDLVTDTPESGRYIIIELKFWDNSAPTANYMPGASVSGGLQGTTSADHNYRISADRAIKLTDSSEIIPKFVQEDVVNHVFDMFVPDQTNPDGEGNMNILVSIDESWEDNGPLPVYVYNHGMGRGGNNADPYGCVQTACGGTALAKLQLENPGKYNAHIIITQNHSNNEANQTALKNYIDKLVAEGKADPNRLYMAGFSMGSMYTMGFYNRFPGYLAAIMPQSGGSFPSKEQLTATPELAKTAVWATAHMNDAGSGWEKYCTDNADWLNDVYKNFNVSSLSTNRAYNFPYFGNYDWTPHETEAQNFSNKRGQMDVDFEYGPDVDQYDDKLLFDWMFDQSLEEEPEGPEQWKLVDPADITIGKSYVIVSENGALTNIQATISTPGDVTGDTQLGMATTPVTIEEGVITSNVTPNMIWQFGEGANTAAASGELGGNAGYYLLNNAPGAGAGTLPLRRESSFNAQHAPLNTTGAAINGNQQSVLLYDLGTDDNAVSLYIWGGEGAWNFALLGAEDGFTAKAPEASGCTAEELIELMKECKLWLYELDEGDAEQHYIMTSAGANGSISPTSLAGHVWVNDGEDVTFTFTPDFGYEVDTVTVDDQEVAVTGNTYTIRNVTADGMKIHVTFKASENAKEVPFDVYNDIFSVGNVTTAVIVDLGEGNAANLADLSADMFTVSAKNTRLDGTTVIFDGTRNVSRVYVNTEPKPLGYILPDPGSEDLVTDTPDSGRYIIVELEFWDANGYLSGAMVSGNLQNAYSAILNYSVNVNREIRLTDGSTVIPFFAQNDVINTVFDKFVHDNTNPDGAGGMDILLSIDESWEDEGPLPLFIYNHGGNRGGPSGDYFAPLQTANGAAVLAKLQIENPGKYNAHIIATQNHSNNQTNNEALIAYVQKLADEGKVDINRVYMSGFSMGGMYTMDFYKRNPEFLAAIVPLACATFPTQEQIDENPALLNNTAIWAHTHQNDPYGDGTKWPAYLTTGAGANNEFKNLNVNVLETNQAFNFPYFGYDWTPHETEAQVFSNLLGQSKVLHRFGPDQEAYAKKNIFDWMFDQSLEKEPEGPAQWKLVDPSDIQIGKSYVIVSENGALTNAQASIPTPGDLNESQTGMASTPVTIEGDVITSNVTPDMIWQFGEGANTAAASGELGGNAGYYLLNDAPGVGGGTSPLRRESSFNAQHANINTTNPAANGNQQSVLLYNFGDGTVALYIWGGDGQWNFVIAGSEDGFVGKSPAASGTNAEQMLELMQENKLKLYELDNGAGNEHYVMASAGANGSISPSSLTGHVWVNDGENVTFTFTPDFGFEVDKVTVDGKEVTVTGNTYTIENVTKDGIEIHVTFKAAENAKEILFDVYNDIFSVGNVTTAVIVDLGEGKAANLADLSADMFSVSTRNTDVLDESNVIYEGSRVISRVYVNTAPELLGYSDPAPGSNDLVTDTPESGRYIIIELKFWDNSAPTATYMPGASVSGGLQGTRTADLHYSINADRAIKLTDGSEIIPRFTQKDVVNPVLDRFVPTQTNPGGEGDMNILLMIDESWEGDGPLPLFIYNHGGGRGGNNADPYGPVQTANGGTALAKMQLENPGKYNAHIIITQNHANNEANQTALKNYIDALVAEGKVDPNRIYMSGFSMGSMYTLGFNTRFPGYLAAIMPQSGGGFPSKEEVLANPDLAKTAVWATAHKDDNGTRWATYYEENADWLSDLYESFNVSSLSTNRAYNFPYFGNYDWTPHETEAQNFSNKRGQMDVEVEYGPDTESYDDKTIFDWMFDQSLEKEPQPAPDKTALNNLIAQADALKADDYTAESFKALEAALDEAKAVSNDKDATEAEIKAATDALKDAMENLVPKEVKPEPTPDKTALNSLIAQADALKADDYTAESFKNFEAALDEAKAVSNDKDATEAEIKAAADALKDAMDKLVLKTDSSDPSGPNTGNSNVLVMMLFVAFMLSGIALLGMRKKALKR